MRGQEHSQLYFVDPILNPFARAQSVQCERMAGLDGANRCYRGQRRDESFLHPLQQNRQAAYLFRAREAALPVLVLHEEDRDTDTADDDEQGEAGDQALGEVALEHIVLVVTSLAGGGARDAARAGGGHLGGGLLDDLGEHSDPRGRRLMEVGGRRWKPKLIGNAPPPEFPTFQPIFSI